MSIDLKIKPSKILADAKFWHCPDGLTLETLPMINEEFNLFRGLFPLKVFITGPPGSGKTYFSEKLSEAYGIPHVKIADVVGVAETLEDEFG